MQQSLRSQGGGAAPPGRAGGAGTPPEVQAPMPPQGVAVAETRRRRGSVPQGP